MTANVAQYIDSKDIVFKLNNGSSLIDISANITGHSFPSEWKTSEITVYGSVGMQYAPSIDATTFTLDLLFNQATTSGTQTVVGAMHAAKAMRAFEFYPAGTATGNTKISGNCWCPKYEIVGKVGTAQLIKAEFKVDNGVTYGTAS